MRLKVALIVSFVSLFPISAFAHDVTGALLPGKRVGVVSLLGDTFHGFGMGLTAFANVQYSAEVPDWDIDRTITNFLLARLNDRGCAAEPLNIQPKHAQDFFLNGHPDDPDVMQLRQLADAQRFDTLVYVMGAPDAHAPSPPGYGLFEQGGFGLYSVFPYADFRLTVLDVVTGKKLATDYSYGVEGKRRKDIPWKTSLDQYSPQERSLIRRGIEDHIQNELTRMLKGMGIAQSPR